MAAISTVSSSSRRDSTVPSIPNSLRRPARNARPASPCSSSVIPSAMSTVSFGSVLRWGAFSADGPVEEPFLEPSRDLRAGGGRLAAVAAAAGRAARPGARSAAVRTSGRPSARRCITVRRARALSAEPSARPSRPLGRPGDPPGPVCPPAGVRSRRGRAPTGRTRARTRASTRIRPKSPVLGSLTTITSASPTATPSWSRARSVASSTGLCPPLLPTPPVIEPFSFRFERDRGCGFGAGVSVTSSAPASRSSAACLAAGFRPLARARPLVPGRSWSAAGSPWPPRCRRWRSTFLTAGSGALFGRRFLLVPSSLARPISRSCPTGDTMPVRNITSCVPIRIAEDTTM